MKNIKRFLLVFLMVFAFTCVFACDDKKEEHTVAVEETEISLEVGEEKMLQADKSEGAVLEWSSSDSEVVTVANGKLTAVGEGTAVVTVKVQGTDIKDEVTVTVTKSVVVASKVEVAGPQKVEVGSTAQYTATVTPADAEGTVAWSVSDDAIASIDQNGKLTAKAVGAVKVIATIGEVKCEYAVNVSDVAPVEPTEVQLWVDGAQVENGGTIEVTEFDVIQLEFKYLPADKPVLEGVDVASGNEYVASIDEELKLTAVAPGQTYIAVSATYAVLEYSFNVNVIEKHFAPESIVVSGDAKLEVNEEGLVAAVVSPERASQEVKWSSSDENIAVVDPTTGVVTGKGVGKVTITATSTEVETVVGTYEIEIVAEVVYDRTVIYVNPAYTNKGEKVTVDGKELIVGKNAVDSITKAAKNVAEGGKVVITAGTYVEKVSITKGAYFVAEGEVILSELITLENGLNGLTFDGIKFNEGAAILSAKGTGENGTSEELYENVTIKNCTFDYVGSPDDATFHIYGLAKNFVFENNSFGFTSYRGIRFESTLENLTVVNNEFTNKSAVYDVVRGMSLVCGEVLVDGNTFTNCTQTMIQFANVGGQSTYTFTNNVFVNAANACIDVRVVKAGLEAETNVVYNIKYNTFDGGGNTWGTIRLRAAGLTAEQIVANINYNKFLNIALDPTEENANWYVQQAGTAVEFDYINADYNYCTAGAYQENWVQNCTSAEGWFATAEELDAAISGDNPSLPEPSVSKVVVAPAFENNNFELDGVAYEVGVNAFTSIADAIAAVSENGTVLVLAGEYVLENTIVVNKTVSILGPNHEVAEDARVEEAVIKPVEDDDKSKYSFDVQASNVVISGLKFVSEKSLGNQNRRVATLTGEIENATFTYNYLLNFNTLVEKGSTLKLKGTLNINNNVLDGHGQFIVWLAPDNDLTEFSVLNLCDNHLIAPQDTAVGQFAYGAISMRHEGATCEVNILRNVFDFAGSKINQYFVRVCSGKLTISENTFINLEAGKLFGGVTTTDWIVKGNTYLDAEGNAVEAPELGNGVEEFVPATEITVDPNGEVKTIAEALEKIAEGGKITVLAGTYADALTIDKAVTILGPNAGKSGLATDRAEEAVINASIVVAAEGVTIDGVKLDVDANVEFQAGNAKLANVYSLASNCIVTSAINRTGVLYATAEVSNIEILDSYFNIGAQSYLKGVWASGVEVSNITFKGNYFTHESTDNTSISDCIAMYAVAGELNFVNNHFVWVTDDWDLFIGHSSNKCTVVNIIENTFDGVDTLYTCGNTVRRLQEGAVCNVIGNTFNTLSGTIFSSDNSVAGAVINIKYNAYMNCKYKQGSTDATCNIENNYYALEQTTATNDYGVIKSKEELDAAYGASDASSDLFISEYCEGSSNNKYLEIYNGTGSDIDLADYQLWNYANGATETNSYGVLQLEGVVKAGDVFVVSNSKAALEGITSNSDQNSSNAVNFNGDDAVVLVKKNAEGGYDIVDLFGVIGEKPSNGGWDVNGSSTKDCVFVRNANVKNPSATWNTAEWTALGKDVTTDCGKHTVE